MEGCLSRWFYDYLFTALELSVSATMLGQGCKRVRWQVTDCVFNVKRVVTKGDGGVVQLVSLLCQFSL